MNLTVDDLYRIIAEQKIENWVLMKKIAELTPKPEPEKPE